MLGNVSLRWRLGLMALLCLAACLWPVLQAGRQAAEAFEAIAAQRTMLPLNDKGLALQRQLEQHRAAALMALRGDPKAQQQREQLAAALPAALADAQLLLPKDAATALKELLAQAATPGQTFQTLTDAHEALLGAWQRSTD